MKRCQWTKSLIGLIWKLFGIMKYYILNLSFFNERSRMNRGIRGMGNLWFYGGLNGNKTWCNKISSLKEPDRLFFDFRKFHSDLWYIKQCLNGAHNEGRIYFLQERKIMTYCNSNNKFVSPNLSLFTDKHFPFLIFCYLVCYSWLFGQFFKFLQSYCFFNKMIDQKLIFLPNPFDQIYESCFDIYVHIDTR